MQSILEWLAKRAHIAMLGRAIIGVIGLIVLGIIGLIRSLNHISDEEYESKRITLRVNSIVKMDTLTSEEVGLFFVDTFSYVSNVAKIKSKIDSCVHCYAEAKPTNGGKYFRSYKCWDAKRKDTILIKTDIDLNIISVDFIVTIKQDTLNRE